MGSTTVYSLTSNGSYIFAGGQANIYMSGNEGINWSITLPGQIGLSMTSGGSFVFAGSNGGSGLWVSSNYGNNWSQTQLTQEFMYALAKNGTNIFAGTSHGVFFSSNNGTNWSQTTLNNYYVYSLVVSGTYVIAGTSGNGIFVSMNSGITWSQSGMSNNTVYSLCLKLNNFFAGTNSGVFISTDFGQSWIPTSLTGSIYSLLAAGTNLFAGSDGIFLSTDEGVTWIPKNQGIGTNTVNSLCSSGTYIFAGTVSNSVYRRSLSEIIGVSKTDIEIPQKYSLEQNYPNPFNQLTIIKFQLPIKSNVVLKIFDILGREVVMLVNESLQSGTYEVKFDAGGLTSGIYFYQFRAGNIIKTKKMILKK